MVCSKPSGFFTESLYSHALSPPCIKNKQQWQKWIRLPILYYRSVQWSSLLSSDSHNFCCHAFNHYLSFSLANNKLLLCCILLAFKITRFQYQEVEKSTRSGKGVTGFSFSFFLHHWQIYSGIILKIENLISMKLSRMWNYIFTS